MTENERLAYLAQHLRCLSQVIPREPELDPIGFFRGFDMRRWADECGSASCALGHACTLPEFEAQGLHLRRWNTGYSEPVYAEETDLDAAQAFFGLTQGEAGYLFFSSAYSGRGLSWISPRQVAERIEALLEQRQKEKHGDDLLIPG